MRWMRSAVWTVLVMSLVLVAPARAQDEPAPLSGPSALETYVDGMIEAAMRLDHVAGVSVAIVKGDQIVLLKGYGQSQADGTPVDPEHTLFRVASISKTFTWIALMNLVEEGRVDLDNPINAYLPPTLRVPDDGFSEPIRVRHLLTHSAGFENLVTVGGLTVGPDQALPLFDSLAQNRPRRIARPGERINYSNYGTALAGAIIQSVTRSPFEDYIEQAVLTPLGLQNTTFREPYSAALAQAKGLPSPMAPALAEDLAQPFRWSSKGFQPQPMLYGVQFAPAASASATASDMGRYLLRLKAGLPSILSPETAAGFSTETPTMANAPGMNGVAQGMMQFRSPEGARGWGHRGSFPYFYSDLVVFPELDLGVFFATNSEGGVRLRDAFAGAVADWFRPGERTEATPNAPALPLSRFAGVYFTEWRAHTTAERAFCLSGCTQIVRENGSVLSLKDGARVSRLAPIDVVDGRNGFRAHRFRDLDTGQISAFQERSGRILRYFEATGLSAADRISPLAGPWGLFLAMLVGGAAAAAALFSGVSRVFSRRQSGPGARLVGLVLPAAGLAWLAAIAALVVTMARAQANNLIVFTDWPGLLNVGLWAASAAAGLTAIAGLATLASWTRADWSIWRRTRILATLASMAALAATLHFWHLLAPIA